MLRRRRRMLLYASMGALLGFLASRWGPTILSLIPREAAEAEGVTAARPPRPNPYRRGGKSLVAVVHGGGVPARVEGALEMLGGLARLGVKGRAVLVKPNVVSASPSPVTTNPEVVAAVVALLRRAGAGRVVVADGSAFITLPTRDNLRATGIEAAALRAGADAVVAVEEQPWVRVRVPGPGGPRVIRVSRLAYDFDLLVNVPVIKTHRYATHSLALKNLLGLVHPADRPSVRGSPRWEEEIAEANFALHPDLHVLDGSRSLVAGGPLRGETAETGLVIASGDRLAAELVGLAVIKALGRWSRVAEKPVWEQAQVRRAVELGLGVAEAGAYEVLARSLDAGASAARFAALMDAVRGALYGGGRWG